MQSEQEKIAIIILAAGASRRLGQPKQLVEFQGMPLLRRVANTCCAARLGEVFVVLGCNAALIRKSLEDLPALNCLEHKGWAAGMGSTMAFAAQQILQGSSFEAAIFVLSDQVHFSSQILEDLKGAWLREPSGIILCRYQVGQGPPSLFGKDHFEGLAALGGDEGAKALVNNHMGPLAFIDFPNGHLDVDTPEDLKMLKSKE